MEKESRKKSQTQPWRDGGKKTERLPPSALPPSACIFFSAQRARTRIRTSLRSNFNDQFLMVWRCSGSCFFFFSSALYTTATPIHFSWPPRAAPSFHSARHRRRRRRRRRPRRALFFFRFPHPSPRVYNMYFFSFGRHISAAGSGYVLFIDVSHGAQFPLFFTPRPPPVNGSLVPARARARFFYAARGVASARMRYAPRIIMCKKPQPIRYVVRAAESPGISPPPSGFQLSFSTCHKSGFFFLYIKWYTRTPSPLHGSYYCIASARTKLRAYNMYTYVCNIFEFTEDSAKATVHEREHCVSFSAVTHSTRATTEKRGVAAAAAASARKTFPSRKKVQRQTATASNVKNVRASSCADRVESRSKRLAFAQQGVLKCPITK